MVFERIARGARSLKHCPLLAMNIREASSADSAAILHIQREVHELHVEREPKRFRPISDSDLEAYLNWHLGSDKSLVFVAVHGEDIVGYLVLEIRESAPTPFTFGRRYGLVDQMGVGSAWRRQGIGEQLLKVAVERCAREGLESIQLDVRASNDKARIFYEACGFTVVNLHMTATI
jgi:ribosomal protein S18 acetylase RimI-like enzyme